MHIVYQLYLINIRQSIIIHSVWFLISLNFNNTWGLLPLWLLLLLLPLWTLLLKFKVWLRCRLKTAHWHLPINSIIQLLRRQLPLLFKNVSTVLFLYLLQLSSYFSILSLLILSSFSQLSLLSFILLGDLLLKVLLVPLFLSNFSFLLLMVPIFYNGFSWWWGFFSLVGCRRRVIFGIGVKIILGAALVRFFVILLL